MRAKIKKLTAQVKALPVENTESAYAKIKQLVHTGKQRREKEKVDNFVLD